MKIHVVQILLLIVISIFSLIFAQTPDIVINEFLASNAHINYDPDYKNYSDWFELYNNEDYSINLNGYYLTDDLTVPTKWTVFNDIIIEPYGYLVFWADEKNSTNHTNFKINADGEQIGIYTPDGNTVDEVTFQTQQTDISYGRNSNNISEWIYYYNPTPGTINATNGNIDLVNYSSPLFSENSGFYGADLFLEITSDPDTEIRYTLDGSEPDEDSELYITPIHISDRTGDPNYFSQIPTNIDPYSWIQPWFPPMGEVRKATIVRARTYSSSKIPSSIVTHTYFIGSELEDAYNTIPVISLVSDEKHLFSDQSGIYVPGVSYADGQGRGNYFQDWDRPAYIEYFDESGNLQLSQEVDIKIQGTTSPHSPQKGLHIIARDKYGKSTIDYPLFKDGKSKANKLTSFKRFMIRAWGTVWNNGMVNDALAQTIYAKSSLDIQDYCPVIVFLNGEYWGLQEIREANKNPYYYQEHYGIDINDPGIDLIVGAGFPYKIDEGDDNHWQNMIEYLNNNDLSIVQNYEYIKTQMDVDNFIDYIGHCVYCGKGDWPSNNEAWWRPKITDGRWKWIQYDMDFSLWNSLISESIPSHNLLDELLNNQYFKFKFINWFMDRINSDFLPEIFNNNYNDILNDIYPYLNEHIDRWALSPTNFDKFTRFIRNFISNRPYKMQIIIQSHFNLGNLNTLTVNSEIEGGTVKINSLLLDENTARISESTYPWSGEYFEDIPIELIATPNEGFVFDRWEGSLNSQSNSISYTLTEDASLTAVFSPIERIDSLYINELLADNENINTNTNGKYDDWIELYNASNDTINLAGLYITDDFTKPTKWKFSDEHSVSFNILPDEYKIIWCDSESNEGQDHVDFSLNGMGEQISLTQIAGNDTVFIDSLSFSEQLPNVSYGRFPDASNKWEFMLLPTPGGSNVFKPISKNQLNSPQLFQNYPNPFNINTNIPFYLIEANAITIDIYSITGNLVRSLTKKENDIGYGELFWDGRDNYGNSLSSGIYFYRLQIDDFNQTKKMLFLK